MTIFFYSTTGRYGCFSNFSRHGFELDSLYWPTSEHYFQAQKFAGTPYLEEVRLAKTPKEAARRGRRREWPLRPDWEQVKDAVMRGAVQRKFETHADIREVLLSTGDEELIEDSPTDAYWGCGAKRTGQNKLGQILMEVRTLLRTRSRAEKNMTSFDPVTHEQLKREIIGVFDRAANLYDQVGIKQFIYYADRLLAKLNIPAGAQVLDVATGRGALLFAAAEKVGPNGSVLGIDLAPRMVLETAAEIKARGISQAEVQLMDADEVSFPDHSFDYILCGSALHFLDYPHVLPRFRDMLKPGGSIATTHFYTPIEDAENFERWKWLFELTREVFPANFEPPASWVAPNRLNKPELIESALHEAGFENISITTEEATLYFVDEHDWWAWEWSQGSRFWLEGMSPEGLAKFKAVSSERLKAMKSPQGIPMLSGALFAIANSPTSHERPERILLYH